MNVFADMHQGALYNSLRLLFERRLGWELFRPIGMEWWEKGFWRYSQLEDTIRQYLQPKEGDRDRGTHWECPDRDFAWTQKALTFEQFLGKEIGIIVASVGPHEDAYFELRERHKPTAKLIRQIGNWDEEADFNKSRNIMISSGPFVLPDFVNYVVYHQEFDLKDWCYTPPTVFNSIKNFVNCYPDGVDFALWDVYRSRLPEMDFKMHGIGGTDGNLSPQAKVREAMATSSFVWQIKLGGEGFGHVIHNAAALGRPVITKGSYYRGKMAEPLLLDGVTCIDLDRGTLDENVKKIRFFSDPGRFRKMSQKMYARFREVCDFDREELSLREFLGRLL